MVTPALRRAVDVSVLLEVNIIERFKCTVGVTEVATWRASRGERVEITDRSYEDSVVDPMRHALRSHS